MVRSYSFAWILGSLLSFALAAPLQAGITPSGDVDPTNDPPDYWWTNGGDSSTNVYIGKTATGSVNVNLDSDLSSHGGYIGYEAGSTGEVTVDGSGSTWTNNSDIYVGDYGQGMLNITNGGSVISNSYGCIGLFSGSTGEVTVAGNGSTWTNSGILHIGCWGQGTLNITNGGAVNVTGDTWVARYDGAAGEIHFDGGTLTTTRSFLAGAIQLTGTGTINTHSLVSDVDLLFDSTHGPNQTLTLNSQLGQNITINLTQNSTGYMGAGYTGEGTLTIRDGVSVKSHTGYIGYKAGAAGEVTVDGNDSTWTSSHNLYVGLNGQGTLNITNGGAVSNYHSYIGYDSGSASKVTVDGSGSTWTNSGWLYVGYYGQVTLDITNGGAVISNYDGYIGLSSSSTGMVTVDGNGSTWNSVGLCVGDEGHGTLNITNDGTVSNTWGYIGGWSGSTGEVTVDGSGSTWTSSGWLYVGFSGGQGMLNITNGGAVISNNYVNIGYSSGSTGEVTVDGSGSTWTNSGGLYIGYNGQGTLNITNGGAVNNNDSGYIGYYYGSTGEVMVNGSGSTWTNSGSLYIGGSDGSAGGTGTVAIENNGQLSVGGVLNVWSAGSLNIGATGQVTVGEALVLTQDSTLTVETGATIHMTGSAFENRSTNPDNLAGLANLTMIFEGGSEDVDPFEVAGEDMGPIFAGLESNFALGTLQLGGADIGQLQLVDTFDNRPGWEGSEALYVENLVLGAGSTLDLNGLNLYYLNFTDLGGNIDFNGGNMSQVPEPATLALLIVGGMGVLLRRRRN